jgi:hypothetical protein
MVMVIVMVQIWQQNEPKSNQTRTIAVAAHPMLGLISGQTNRRP